MPDSRLERKEQIMDKIPKAVVLAILAFVALLVLATGIASVLLFMRAF